MAPTPLELSCSSATIRPVDWEATHYYEISSHMSNKGFGK